MIDASGRLRAARLRVTRRRVTILDALTALGGHRTADEIAAAPAAAGSPLPRASLYHALAAMADASILLVADAGPGTARFEIAGEWHHHLVCRSCGSISDVPCAAGVRPCLEANLPGAVIDEAQVVFRGLCPACAAGVAPAS